MKFVNKKFTDTIHIYAEGKGKHTFVGFTYPHPYDEGFAYNFDIDDAKELCKYLNDAIKLAEALAQEEEEDEDEDDDNYTAEREAFGFTGLAVRLDIIDYKLKEILNQFETLKARVP